MPTYTQKQEPTILPDGFYWFRVKNAKENTSTKGNDKIELEIEIQGSPTIVYENLTFSEKSFWRIDEFRTATGEKLASSGEVTFNAEDCIARTGCCELFTDDFEGRHRNKVTRFMHPDAVPADIVKMRESRFAPPSPSAAAGPMRVPGPPKMAKPDADNEPEEIPF
jgi:hypothetical protein